MTKDNELIGSIPLDDLSVRDVSEVCNMKNALNDITVVA